MIPCAFIGDSTAYGPALIYNRGAAERCLIVAREGASPQHIARSAIPAEAIGAAVIGTGSNDPASPSLASNLYQTRRRIAARRVLWLLPYDRRAAYTVRTVAVAFGDYVLDLSELPTRDGVHPLTYAGIATALRRWIAVDPARPL